MTSTKPARDNHLFVSVVQGDQHEGDGGEGSVGKPGKPGHQHDEDDIAHEYHAQHGKAEGGHAHQVGHLVAIATGQALHDDGVDGGGEAVEEQPPAAHAHTLVVGLPLRRAAGQVGVAIVHRLKNTPTTSVWCLTDTPHHVSLVSDRHPHHVSLVSDRHPPPRQSGV